MNSLQQRVISGVGWRAATDVSRILLQIGFTAVLARLLSIADFGLAAMCYLFIRFVRSLTDVGFNTAVIQKADVSDAQVSAVFVMQCAIKVVVCALCVALAPVGAAFFQHPELVDLIRVLSIGVVVDSLAFPQTLLAKALDFRGFSILEMASFAAAGLFGVGLALSGFGVWSLIWQNLAQKVFSSVGVWVMTRWRPERPDFRGTGGMVRFGLNLFGSNVLYFWSQNLAGIILGRMLGAEALGAFNIAYNVAIDPAQRVQSVLSSVLSPAFAKFQDRPEELGRRLYLSLLSVALVFIPAMVGVAAVAQNLIRVVYGEKWHQAGALLAVLGFVGLLKGLDHVLKAALIASGRANTILNVTILEAAAAVPLIIVATRLFEAHGTVLAYLVASLVAFAYVVVAAQKLTGDSSLLRKAVGRTLAASAIMFAAVELVGRISTFGPGGTLALQVSAGALVYVVVRGVMLTREEAQVIRSWPVVGRLFKPGFLDA